MELCYVSKQETDKLTDLAILKDCLRMNILYMVQQAGSGHLGGSLSSLDIMLPLFYETMAPDDIFITSKGHDAPALYAIMFAKGLLPFDFIHSLRRPWGLPGHPTCQIPGILFNTGSLGMGISKANGLSISDQIAGRNRTIHVLVGDGELQEGQIAESIRNIQPNVVVHVDANGFQLSSTATLPYNAPEFIIHQTVKGSGISFMEHNNSFHAGGLSEPDYKRAVVEICKRLWDAWVILSTMQRIPYDRPTRSHELVKAYSIALVNLGRDTRIVVLDSDLAPDCGLLEFRAKHPNRFIQCGISEQDMVSTASGIAAGGLIPIVHSFASFLCRRANEQIYNACLESRHIIFVGTMSGMLPVGPGTSHECINDIEIMRTMPNLTILQPATETEVVTALSWAIYESTKPVYISLRCWPVEGMRR